MKQALVIGFDGNPVAGGCGTREAILEIAEEAFLWVTGGRILSRDRFAELADRGYVTRLDPPVQANSLDGVIVYRAANETDAAEFCLPESASNWSRQAKYDVLYVSLDEAEKVLDAHAEQCYQASLAAFRAGRSESAVRLARRGLMAVSDAAYSELAARLYGMLLVSARSDDERKLIQREIGAMLDSRNRPEAEKNGAQPARQSMMESADDGSSRQ